MEQLINIHFQGISRELDFFVKYSTICRNLLCIMEVLDFLM